MSEKRKEFPGPVGKEEEHSDLTLFGRLALITSTMVYAFVLLIYWFVRGYDWLYFAACAVFVAFPCQFLCFGMSTVLEVCLDGADWEEASATSLNVAFPYRKLITQHGVKLFRKLSNATGFLIAWAKSPETAQTAWKRWEHFKDACAWAKLKFALFSSWFKRNATRCASKRSETLDVP